MTSGTGVLPQVRESKSWTLDSTPWIPDSRYWIPAFDSGTWIPDCKPQDSGFYKPKFLGFQNPDSLLWGKCS